MHNKEQQKAIQFGAGPLLVLAGPGSGKTHVITHRIVYLISECKIPPNQILVITFTKAAALEMQHRATSLYQPCSYVQFGTFHSVFYHILRLSNPDKKYSFAADEERITFVKNILEAGEATEYSNLNQTKLMQETEICMKEISIYKNRIFKREKDQSVQIKKYTAEPDHELPEKYRNVYRQYEEWLSENHKLDFDDMLRLCYTQLKSDERLRNYWKQRFSHILIDEFQDINPLQYETIRLLDGNGNIFAVGDDDQAIYSFRGARPEFMKSFLKDYQAEKICLSVNYRSDRRIVEASENLIRHNQSRFEKTIKAASEKEGELFMIAAGSRQEEYDLIRKEILNFQRKFPDKTQAVLTRTNGLADAYRYILENKQTDEVFKEDMTAYLFFINNGQQRKDFLKIMNKPVRYVSASILTEERVDFNVLKRRLQDKPWVKKRLEQLQEQVAFAKRLDLAGQARYIYHAMGYEDYCKQEKINGNDYTKTNTNIFINGREGDCDAALRELTEELKECKSMDEWRERFKELDKKTDRIKIEKNESGLKIMTYHASKGLEFDRVYLPDLEYGKVPHGRMLLKEELEEERRMFYVALTRAKESLWLLYDKSQTGSPFLRELDCGYSSINSSNSQLSRYSSKASSTFS